MREITLRSSLLGLHQYRYFKLSLSLSLVAIVAFLLDDSHDLKKFGGTLLGYVFGIVAALLIAFFLWYGIRKRVIPNQQKQGLSRFGFLQASLQDWLSAHVHMGLLLFILATLHSGFQFAANLHTFLYLLMLLVLASGYYGLYASVNLPRLMTMNMGNDTQESIEQRIDEIDLETDRLGADLSEESRRYLIACHRGELEPNRLTERLSGIPQYCPNQAAIDYFRGLISEVQAQEHAESIKHIYAALLQKNKLLEKWRTDLMLATRMRIWLDFHLPLSMAMLVCLLAHILSILFFW